MKKLTLLILLILAIPSALGATPDFEIAVEDNSPPTDVILSINVINELSQEGYEIEGGSAKLFSEIDATQLDNQVTLVIYEGEARIIFDENDNDHQDMVDDLENILDNLNIDTQTIQEDEIQEENLLEQFDVEIPEPEVTCIDSDDNNPNTHGYVDLITDGIATTKEDYCLSDSILMEQTCQDKEIMPSSTNCEYGCESGKCNPMPEPVVVEEPIPVVINETPTQEKPTQEYDSQENLPTGLEQKSFFEKILNWFKSIF